MTSYLIAIETDFHVPNLCKMGLRDIVQLLKTAGAEEKSFSMIVGPLHVRGLLMATFKTIL